MGQSQKKTQNEAWIFVQSYEKEELEGKLE
jgi:hypothetical protein